MIDYEAEALKFLAENGSKLYASQYLPAFAKACVEAETKELEKIIRRGDSDIGSLLDRTKKAEAALAAANAKIAQLQARDGIILVTPGPKVEELRELLAGAEKDIFEIAQQASRRRRASSAKELLDRDLEFIEEMCEKALAQIKAAK